MLTAVNDLATGGDLDDVLHRVVELACRAAGARYGALGVIDPVEPTRLYRFITYGMTEAERAGIGELPAGLGLLGRLIRDPRPVRLADLSQAPDSVGFPPGHPPMRSFLGMPVQVRGQVFGNLYLTEKRHDRTPEPVFTAADQELVGGLAAVAGAVIDNVQQRAALDSQRAVVDGIWQVHHALQTESAVTAADALPLVTDQVLDLARARAVAVVRARDGEAPVPLASSGDAARVLAELAGPIGAALASGERYDASAHLVAAPGPTGHRAQIGPADETTEQRTRTSLLPIRARGAEPTVLLVAGWRPSSGLSEDRITELLDLFATQVALVLDQSDRDGDRRALALLEDRDRIARDLHDLVIQRLFAVGLQLQGASRLAVRPQVVDRLQSAVTELDATIRDIRSTIFELNFRPGQTSLRSDLRELVSSYAATLGFEPVTQVRGPLDSTVNDDLQIQVLAVLREALSNVARHARASACQVEVEVTDTEILVSVTDDGVGIAESVRESGVRNIRSRAADAGGSLLLRRREPRGTALTWRAPLR